MEVVYLAAVGESVTRKLGSEMLESFSGGLNQVNFRGRKYSKWGRVVTPQK